MLAAALLVLTSATSLAGASPASAGGASVTALATVTIVRAEAVGEAADADRATERRVRRLADGSIVIDFS